MTRMFSHMEDVYLDTSERISSDIKLFLAASLLFILFVMHNEITIIQLFIYSIYYKMILIYIDNRTNRSSDESNSDFGYVSEGYEEDFENDEESETDEDEETEEDEEDKSYDLLNNDLKELKMKKRE